MWQVPSPSNCLSPHPTYLWPIAQYFSNDLKSFFPTSYHHRLLLRFFQKLYFNFWVGRGPFGRLKPYYISTAWAAANKTYIFWQYFRWFRCFKLRTYWLFFPTILTVWARHYHVLAKLILKALI